jgi:hypothetical protein
MRLISLVIDKLLPSRQRHFRVKVKAARRTAAGGFNNAVFKKIGGKDCPRYAALTWKERDKVTRFLKRRHDTNATWRRHGQN